MKSIIKSFLLLAMFLSTDVTAGQLQERSYKGKQNGKTYVDLMLKKAPGREGSFFGLLVRGSEKAQLYLLDELTSSSYALTPLEVTTDGEIGIVNDDPSLVLNTVTDSRGKLNFKIISSNSSNNAGFKGYLEFSNKSKSKMHWNGLKSGNYKYGRNSKALQISDFDLAEREATAVFTINDDLFKGAYTMREKFPSMFTIYKNKTLSTGTEREKIPSSIAVFVNTGGFKKGAQMLLINPKTGTLTKKFIKSR